MSFNLVGGTMGVVTGGVAVLVVDVVVVGFALVKVELLA